MSNYVITDAEAVNYSIKYLIQLYYYWCSKLHYRILNAVIVLLVQ